MKEEGTKRNTDLEQRTFQFAVDVVKFLKTIKYSRENDVIKYQLAKAATSIGANLPCGIKYVYCVFENYDEILLCICIIQC